MPIDQSSLHHQSRSAWCSLLDQQTLQLSLRSKAGDFCSVSLVYAPKYGSDRLQYPRRELSRTLCDQQYDYYQITLRNLAVKRLSYYFILRRENDPKTYCYTEKGLSEVEILQENQNLWRYSYDYAYCNNIDIHHIPDWAKGASIYQVFPDRFARSREAKQLPAWSAWGSPPDSQNIFGGDLKGIESKLEHLLELGADVLYLTPIFQASSNHKYDTCDYKQIDPTFGSDKDFHSLVRKCHQLGLRVILDAVFNHCGPDFAPFVDVQEKGEKSRYKDWFHILRYPLASPAELWEEMKAKAQKEQLNSSDPINPWAAGMGEDGWTILPYETFGFSPAMPKLNTENPEMKEYLLEVAEYWIREYDIDGWRLDVANEVDHVFWREFRRRVHQAKPEALIIGEIWHDAKPWLQGDQFDGVMNYPFQNISFDFFLHRSIDAERARQEFNRLLLSYSPQVNQVQWNMLDSHDTPRLLHSCKGEVRQAMLLLGLQLSYVGSPLLYYGTEIGLAGGPDPDCRRCMPWEKETWNTEIYQLVQRLLQLRREYRVLRTGSLRWLAHPSPDLLAFERFDDSGAAEEHREAALKILLNRGDEALDFRALAGRTDLLSGEVFQGRIAARSMLVL